MSPEVQAALTNAGRLLRLQVADARQEIWRIQAELNQRESHLAQCQDRLEEIKAALASADLELPPVRMTEPVRMTWAAKNGWL